MIADQGRAKSKTRTSKNFLNLLLKNYGIQIDLKCIYNKVIMVICMKRNVLALPSK